MTVVLTQSMQDGTQSNSVPVPATTATQQNLPMRKRKQQDVGSLELRSTDIIKNNETQQLMTVIGKKLKTSSDDTANTNTSTNLPDPATNVTSPATTNIDAIKTEHNTTTTTISGLKPLKRPPMSKAREIRLEQNRKAARESRRRKKVMVEELQRSVVFFTRANSTLKHQNEELERLVLQAQSQIQAYESGRATNQQQQGSSSNCTGATTSPQEPSVTTASATAEAGTVEQQSKESRDSEAKQAVASAQTQQVQKLPTISQDIRAHHAAQAAATQAMFETKGFPPAAARAAAQTFVAAPGSGESDGKGGVSSNPGTASSATSTAQPQPQLATTPTAGNISLASNPWSFLVAMAPGQIPQLANAQQHGASVCVPNAAQTPGTTNSTTGKTEFNPFFAMQMQPFLTTVMGPNGTSISMPIVQLAAMNNKGNLGTAAPCAPENVGNSIVQQPITAPTSVQQPKTSTAIEEVKNQNGENVTL